MEKELLQEKSAKNKMGENINEQGLKILVDWHNVENKTTTKRSPATSSQIELLGSVLGFRPWFSFSAALGWGKGRLLSLFKNMNE